MEQEKINQGHVGDIGFRSFARFVGSVEEQLHQGTWLFFR